MDRSARQIRETLTKPVAPGEAVQLAGSLVHEPLILEQCAVSSFDLSGTVFLSPVVFRDVAFTGLSWFKACVFRAGADFSGSMFTNDARFDGSAFHDKFRLARSEVLGASDFSRCMFHGVAMMDHSTFCGSLSFEDAGFYGKTSLRRVECLGGLWSERALFADAVDVAGMDVHGRTWLRNLRTTGQKPDGGQRALGDVINSYGYQWT
jgi:Pentapeptide repeats (9 copies)